MDPTRLAWDSRSERPHQLDTSTISGDVLSFSPHLARPLLFFFFVDSMIAQARRQRVVVLIPVLKAVMSSVKCTVCDTDITARVFAFALVLFPFITFVLDLGVIQTWHDPTIHVHQW
jgi:hypothetical protein